MRRSLAAGMALLLGCTGGQPETTKATGAPPQAAAEAKASGEAKVPVDAKTPADAKPPAEPTPPPELTPTPAPPPSEPTPPAASTALAPATAELLDRLVPAAERVAVTEAAAKALEIRVIDDALWVTDGKRSAPLRKRASAVTRVTVAADAASGEPVVRIEFQDDVACVDQEQRVEHSARSLLARLENAAAMQPHRKRDLPASARGFARAALLDPSLDVAWTNLACALALQGDTAAAMAALDPVLRRAPLDTYHKVLSDPELAALREQPAVTALRAPTRGNAKIRTLTIAYSAHHALVAVRRQEQSWGACNYIEDLRLLSATTGEPVLSLPLIGWDETEPECDESGRDGKVLPGKRAKVNPRLDVAERFLQDLGFSSSEGLEIVEPPHDPEGGPPTKAKVPGIGLELVIDEKSVRVRKGAEVLVKQPQTEAQGISRAGYDPAARVAFIEWYHNVPEGCADDADGTGFLVIPLPAT